MSEIDAYLRYAQSRLNKFGFVIETISASPGNPRFQYTVGLTPVSGFELIITGLPAETGIWLLNMLAERALKGTRFGHGQVLTDVLEDDYPCTMLHVSDSTGWLNLANHLYRKDGAAVAAWQIVYPDEQRRWPWDQGYTRPVQPLLAPPPRTPRQEPTT